MQAATTQRPPTNPWSSPPLPPPKAATPRQPGSHAEAASKKASKVKDLSHVPCKFYRANACTAGKACPFSHDLPIPGTGKPICQWFAKGTCKFGHKCALAHVLPGQPMSFDRKNKRAAQQALREAQANADGAAGLMGAGEGHAIPGSLGMDGAYGAYPVAGGASSSGTSQGDVDAMFGSPDSLGNRTPASSPGLQHRTLPGQVQHSPLSFATIAQGPTATFIAPASSGLSYQFGSSPSNPRATVAAQAMLSEQARRLSSTSESLSPPRPQHASRARLGVNNGAGAIELPSSPPLAVPGANSAATGATSIFGTSPFSGSRGLFIPSSYDSNEDAFPGSPPSRPRVMPDIQRAPSGSAWNEAVEDDDEDGEDYDEGFLPSSLNDLLTPEEMRRRTLRASGAMGSHGPSSLSSSSPAFDPFMNSKSVPADLFLASGKPSLAPGSGSSPRSIPVPQPTIGARSVSAAAAATWGSLSSSVEGHNPSAVSFEPPTTASLLSQSRTREATVVPTSPAIASSASNATATPPTASSLLSSALNGSLGLAPPVAGGMYSASFSDAALRSPPPTDRSALLSAANAAALRYPQTGLSPSTNASLAAPGSSLPGGLAAGLSRLHLVPPAYTGETPPSSSPNTAYLSSSPSHAPAPGSALARRMSGTAAFSPSTPPTTSSSMLVSSPLRDEIHLRMPGFSVVAGAGGSGQGTPEPLSAVTERAVPVVFGTITGPPGSMGAAREGSVVGDEDDDRHEEGDEVIQFDME